MRSWRNSWDTSSWKICGFHTVDIKSKDTGMKLLEDFFFLFMQFGHTFLVHEYSMWSINVDLLKYKNLLSLLLLENTCVSFSTPKRKVKSVSFKAAAALMRVSHSTQGGKPIYFYYTTLLTGTILKRPNDRQGPRLDASSVDS